MLFDVLIIYWYAQKQLPFCTVDILVPSELLLLLISANCVSLLQEVDPGVEAKYRFCTKFYVPVVLYVVLRAMNCV